MPKGPDPRNAKEVAEYLVAEGLRDPDVLEGDLGLKHFGAYTAQHPRQPSRAVHVDHGLREDNQADVIRIVRRLLENQP